MQEGQDIFGVDFDFDEFEKYGEDYGSESGEDDYEEDEVEGEREKRPKKAAKKKTTKKSIFEIYEPSELKRGHFTDVDNEVSLKYNFFFEHSTSLKKKTIKNFVYFLLLEDSKNGYT